MKSFDRISHDIYSSVMTSLAGSPVLCEEMEGGHLLCGAGDASLDQSLEAKFHGYSEHVRHYKWRKAVLHEIDEVDVVGDQANIFLNDGRFLQICPSLVRLGRGKIRRPIRLLGKREKGVFFHLSGRDHENHGHFLSQHITRLLAAREWLKRYDEYRILLAPKHAKWQGRYLKVLGFDPARISLASEGTLRLEKLLYVPMWYGDSYLVNPSIYQEIAKSFERLAQTLGVDVQTKNRILFVSRRDAPNKVLLNEEKIIDICRNQLGEVEVLDLKNVPFEEQVKKFSQASWIIGAQGQGMTNVLFCRKSKVIILEAGKALCGNEGWCLGYRDMALSCDHQAIRLNSGTDRDEHLNWIYPEDKFKSDLGRLRELLS